MKRGFRVVARLAAALAIVSISACSHHSNGTVGATVVTPSGSVNWAWQGGAQYVGQSGAYGTVGVAAATNQPGGRDSASTWTDSTGALWLFGGTGYDVTGSVGSLNDLWKYTPSTREWTWVGGASNVNAAGTYGTLGLEAPTNQPGARAGAVSWVDKAGNFWLFGGVGYDSLGVQGDLNDLWVYSPMTGQWTWLSGAKTANAGGIYGTRGVPAAGNGPGAREGAVAWVDSNGALWLFGGGGYDGANGNGTGNNGRLNDLWKYEPSTRLWAWVAGSNLVNGTASYGTLGATASTNVPGPRQAAMGWSDSSGDLWLFGGTGIDSGNNNGYLNDLWKYVPSSRQWTWVSGSSLVNAAGIYGTQATPSTTNVPGARAGANTFTDASGNLWMFGGQGLANTGGSQGYLNDLWEYMPSTGQWQYLSGGASINSIGVYGTLATPARTNSPGGRYYAASWYAGGKFWLFGGGGYDSVPILGDLNDLWSETP